jgi:hypothetical protein
MISQFRCSTWAISWLLVAAPLGAQLSRSADATASVSIPASLTLMNSVGLDFGTHFASEGVIIASAPAQWFGTTDPGNNLSFSFVLPASLAKVGGGGNGPVPITFGSTSAAAFTTDRPDATFNPAAGFSGYTVGSDGTYGLYLGATAGSGRVSVDLTGRSPGNYQGVITLTVTVL